VQLQIFIPAITLISRVPGDGGTYEKYMTGSSAQFQHFPTF
jgi:hypothetical protein